MDDQMSLRLFISSLDPRSLPRIIEICSGVYFQGSVYELSGSEVCLSTGDLVKIIGLELVSVSCEESDTGDIFSLSSQYQGQFKLVTEDLPYNTLEEMLSLCPVGVEVCGAYCFRSRQALPLEDFTIPAGTVLTLSSLETSDHGERRARCQLQGHNMSEVLLPLTLSGEFYECEDEHQFSLSEILSSARLSSRRFRTIRRPTGSPLFLSPVYEVKATMHMRKDIVKFPSSLEVDVLDVTEQFQDLKFVTPLTLSEVASQPAESFPTMAEVLDGPEVNPFLNCSWCSGLQKGRDLVIHGGHQARMVLSSTPKGRKGKQFFLVSDKYGGRMRRRQREFGSVYELYLAASKFPGLTVSVTRHCEAVEEDGIPALSIGDNLEVLTLKGLEDESGAAPECLICKRTVEEDDEEEQDEDVSEELSLPLFMTGQFVEKPSDNKKCNLSELLSGSWPLDVKVVSRDKRLKKDPLMGLTGLNLEETFTETIVLASLPTEPEHCFELPVRWLKLSVSLTSDPLPWSHHEPPELHTDTVTEVTENFYHEYLKATSKDEPPPPRPPKKPKNSHVPTDAPKPNPSPVDLDLSLTSSLEKLSLGVKGRRAPAPPPVDNAPAPPRPKKSFSICISSANTYVQRPKRKRKPDTRTTSDSEHDYESVDETLINARTAKC